VTDTKEEAAMREPTFTPEAVERLLDRISEASARISKDIEAQATSIDRRIKELVDQGEKITRRLVETIDKDLRAQLVPLRNELEQLAHRLVEFRSSTLKKVTPNTAAAQKTVAKKAAPKPVAKKTAARKPVAKKTAARKPVAKKTVRKLAA
jgi:hypothetical protein